jgi:hypothetical protein
VKATKETRREKIADAVRAGSGIVAWVTPKGVIQFEASERSITFMKPPCERRQTVSDIYDQDITRALDLLSALRKLPDGWVSFIVVEGITGLASLDPKHRDGTTSSFDDEETYAFLSKKFETEQGWA